MKHNQSHGELDSSNYSSLNNVGLEKSFKLFGLSYISLLDSAVFMIPFTQSKEILKNDTCLIY